MKKQATIGIIAVLGLMTLVGFQNCGGDIPESMFDLIAGTNDVYEMKVDQVAYMSCAEQANIPNDDSVLFSFRVGAYGNNTGLHLTDSFREKYLNDSPGDLLNTLRTESLFSGSQVQFALRKQADLAQMYINGDSADGLEGTDFDYTFGIIGSEEVSASLIKTNATASGWLNYFAAAGVNKDAYFEGSMVFNSSEADAAKVRTFLISGGGILATTLADLDKPANIRTNSYAYDDDDNNDNDLIPGNYGVGVGLKLGFKQPAPLKWSYSGSAHINMPKRVLSTVTEYNLASPTKASGTWTCPSELQFRIVDPADVGLNDADGVGSPLCTMTADPATLSADLKRVRNSLPASDWYVNMAKQCIVPRRYVLGSCYGIDSGTGDRRGVQYDVTKKCGPAISSTATPYVCSHFVSICYKTQ